ncbi:MAG: HAD family hydrolase [Methanomassiliicoccales archaeon]|nr:HAD family hydrolase [Methanomassiliicoccales archaeon]
MSENGSIKAVVFDLDNTLVESAINFREMRRRIVRELELSGATREVVDEERTVLSNIRAGRDYISRLRDERYVRDLDLRLGGILTDCELSTVPTVRAIDGARQTVCDLKVRGYAVGILTRGSRVYAEAVLAKTELSDLIRETVCRDDYPLEEAKPNPIAMERITSRLGTVPGSSVYVGDHPIDYECARASGSRFIGLLSGATTEEKWMELGCDFVKSAAQVPDAVEAMRRG